MKHQETKRHFAAPGGSDTPLPQPLAAHCPASVSELIPGGLVPWDILDIDSAGGSHAGSDWSLRSL